MASGSLRAGLDPSRYEIDEEDGLPREIVGAWAEDKHARLRKYVGISAAVRPKFVRKGNEATYIDLFCGPGRARIEGTSKIIDGSSIVAWKESLVRQAPFTRIFIADSETSLADATEARLKKLAAPVAKRAGPAALTVDEISTLINSKGLHFAFLDPFNLGTLHFSIIRKLAAFQQMDILVHISGQDLRRNLRRYIDQQQSALDDFAPRWREHVNTASDDFNVRAAILAFWKGLVREEDMRVTEGFEKVTGLNNQPLYWLAFAARHKLALEFWSKIKDISGESELPF